MKTTNLKKNILDISLLLISIYGLIWIVIGAFYSYPNAEDLTESAFSRDHGVFPRLIDTLQIVDGRYTTNFLHGFNPLTFGYYYAYQLMPIILFLLLFTGVYFLLKALSKTGKNHFVHSFTLVILFLGAMDLSSSFFWMICSFVYLYPIVFILFFFNFFIRYIRTKTIIYFFLSLVFIFLTVGSSELSIPTVGGILIGLLCYYWDNKEIKKAIFLLISVYLISSVLLLTSPGVLIRMSHYEESSSVSIISVLKWSLKYTSDTFATFKVIPLFLYLIIFTKTYFNKPNKIKRSKRKIDLIIVIGFGMIYAIWFVVIYAKGDEGFSSRVTTFPIAIATFIAILLYSKVILLFKQTKLSQSIILIMIVFFTYNNSSYSLVRKDFKSNKLSVFKEEMDLQYRVLSAPKKCDSSCISKYAINDIAEFLPESVTDSPVKYLKKNRSDLGGNRAYEKYFKIDEVGLKEDTIHVLNKIDEIINH